MDGHLLCVKHLLTDEWKAQKRRGRDKDTTDAKKIDGRINYRPSLRSLQARSRPLTVLHSNSYVSSRR